MATTTPLRSVTDGPRLTVNDYLKDPLRVPALVLDMMKGEFISDAVLRDAGGNFGAVRFEESTPQFADGEPEVRAEFAEVPVVPGSVGVQHVTFSAERALAVMVSDEMKRRQNVDAVNRQMTQVKNTMVRAWDRVFFNALLTNPNLNAPVTAVNEWGTATSTIRKDLASAIEVIETAVVDATNRPDDVFGYEPDVLIINHATKGDLFANDEIAKIWQGNIADENIVYTGKLPNKLMGLNVLVSRRVPADTAIVMQRGRVGFISDELPLQATPLYRDEPRKSMRSDVQRASAVGVDNPRAAVLITGIGPS